MKCGHPDVMENLYWNRDDRTKIGGVWHCRTCRLRATESYISSVPGMLAYTKAHIKYDAKQRRA